MLRVTARSAKNILGAMLVVVGMILVLPGVPGQGVLTILVGVMLLDLPGKRRLERRIVGRPRILRTINGLRKRFGQPPLVLGRRRGAVQRKGHRLFAVTLQAPARDWRAGGLGQDGEGLFKDVAPVTCGVFDLHGVAVLAWLQRREDDLGLPLSSSLQR